jgi:hypothetical protein
MPISLKRLADAEPNFRRLLLVTLLYLLPAFQALLPVEDPDLWWHLRTGQWIVDHGQVPFEDPFSAFGSGKPWIAYSWLYEILVYGLFRAFGLVGIVWFTVVMSTLIALALHVLVRRAKLPFLMELIVVALALSAMKPIYSPRSWLFSILFFAVELNVALRVRSGGKPVLLALLPPIFLLWANLHIQFSYGLAVLGFLAVESLFAAMPRSEGRGENRETIPLGPMIATVFACLLATLVNPYHYRLLLVFLEIAAQTEVFQYVQELQPLFFRTPADWFILALALMTAFSLGWQKNLRLLPLGLLLMAVLLSFRARRDSWVVVTVAAALIGDNGAWNAVGESFGITKARIFFVVAAVIVALGLMSRYREINEPHLQQVVESRFPVNAVAFVRQNRFPGPLYNNFDWGGYLIWSLPELPVSIDGRGNVHGDPRIIRSIRTWAGYPGWESDPELVNARLVIAEPGRPLTAHLRRDARFKLVYEDKTAAVFVSTAGDPSNK